MKFFSTNGNIKNVSLKEAVLKGLADDNGLFMPEKIPILSGDFYNHIRKMSLQEIAFEVSKVFFSDDIEENILKNIIEESLNFPIPLVPIHNNIYTLELFHGPTLAFKDVGARFMARLLKHFSKNIHQVVNVLVATSGDTGSAVANGFLNVPEIRVFILYPKGLVSKIQEMQFTTLNNNITALEVEGTFDDCQHLVKQAFLDEKIKSELLLTSANSISLARLLPQTFYYFYGYAQLPETNKKITISVPSGNFGNLTAGLIAKKMGLPVRRFIAATNVNDIVPKYLLSGIYEPKKSVATIANAMDVGNPSNFARILDLYNHSHKEICKDIIGYSYQDDEIKKTIKKLFASYNYLLDPHGAVGYKALKTYLKKNDEIGFFIETAHPAKFKSVVEEVINKEIKIPERLQYFLKGKKKTTIISKSFNRFKEFLLNN